MSDIEVKVKAEERDPGGRRKKPRLSLRARIIFFSVAWLIVLMPFLFWHSTWFGRPLNQKEMAEYLRDEQKPRHIQHALVQIGEHLEKGESAEPWAGDLVRLANHRVEEIRATDAWVMGQDNRRPEFHEALLKMLDDESATVRANAALSLVRFGDDAGREQIRKMLEPVEVVAPQAGRVVAAAQAGEPIRRGTMVVKLETDGQESEVRAPISGRLHAVNVAAGSAVSQGQALGVIAPGVETAWEGLRALYLVGQMEDLEVVRRYKRPSPELPDRVQQQARLTEAAILERAKKQ